MALKFASDSCPEAVTAAMADDSNQANQETVFDEGSALLVGGQGTYSVDGIRKHVDFLSGDSSGIALFDRATQPLNT